MKRTPQDIQDELLVLECQDGSQQALRALYSRWQPRFAGLAIRLTADREAARDVVQDTWLAIVRGIGRLDDPARFRVWAYHIATNKCADWLRRRVMQRRTERDLAADTAPIAQSPAATASDEVERMRAVLPTLPQEQRVILFLHYFEEIGISEISRILKVPPGTVKSRLFHARNKLKTAMERTKS